MKKNVLLFLLVSFTLGLSHAQTYFEESFDGSFVDNWVLLDEDGDNANWFAGVDGQSGTAHTGSGFATSASWANVALTPDNWLISPSIDLTNITGNITLDYWVRAQDQTWPAEHYACYISTTGGLEPSDFSTVLYDDTLKVNNDANNNLYEKRSINLSQYAGQTINLAWRHFNCTNQFRINLDDVIVYKNEIIDAGITAITAPSNNNGCNLTNTESVSVTIFNYGGAPITNFDVAYSVDGGTPVVETVTDTVLGSSSLEYTFSQTVDLSALGYYTIGATTMLANDANSFNDAFETKASHGDAVFTVVVSTDSQSGQSWHIVNSSSDTIASHGAYQWDITDTTTVCIIDDDCYSFLWDSEQGSENIVTIYYNGVEVSRDTVNGSFSQISIGSGCPHDGIQLVSINTPKNVVIGDINISGTIKNTGQDTLTSFDVVYNANGAASTTYSVSGISVNTGKTYDFTHDVPYNTTGGTISLEVAVSNPNGNTDPSPSDNTKTKELFVFNEAYQKVILGEEATGTWCGWCVRGHVGLKDMAHNHDDGSWIGIAVHNDDPMANSEYDAAIGDFITGYPSGVINRLPIEIDPSLFEQAYTALKDELPMAKVVINSATMNADTREVSVDASSIFALDTAGVYKLLMIVVEDSVTGTSSGYAQVNYYAADGLHIFDWENIDWSTLGDPIPAADMVYNHVGRYIVGGFNGVSGSVPMNTTYNTPNNYQFTTTLPTDINADQASVVVILLDGDGNYINSTQLDVSVVVNNVNIGNSDEVQIFPNPTSGEVTLQGKAGSSIHVYDLLGQLVLTAAMKKDKTSIDLSQLNNGAYWIEIFDNNTLYSKKVILDK